MSISISAIIEQKNEFESQQLKQFEQFIDTSKKLKGSLKTAQQDAEKNYTQMQSTLQSLSQSVETNGLYPIEACADDPSYVDALDSVNILPDNLNSPQVSIPYMDTFLDKIKQYMASKESPDE